MAVMIRTNTMQMRKSIVSRALSFATPSRIIKPVIYPQRVHYETKETKLNVLKVPRFTRESSDNKECKYPASATSKFEDYYKVLGVEYNASFDDIKKAYYVLAKRFHPDRGSSKSSAENFKKISEAYNILSDSAKKHRYDELCSYGGNMAGVKILSSSSFRSTNQTQKLKQLLEKQSCTIESISPEMAAKYRHDIIDVNLTFQESVQGTTKDLYVKSLQNCPKCNQSFDRKSLSICQKCNGLGTFVLKTKTYTCRKECDCCYGRCYIPQFKCDRCQNRGFVLKENKVKVHIKAGVKHNEVLRILHPNDRTSEVRVKVHVQESADSKRKNNDTNTGKMISISDAVLGGTVKLRGIKGDLNLDIKPGTESYLQIKLPNRNVKSVNPVTEHDYITVKIEIPKKLTKEHKSLLQILG